VRLARWVLPDHIIFQEKSTKVGNVRVSELTTAVKISPELLMHWDSFRWRSICMVRCDDVILESTINCAAHLRRGLDFIDLFSALVNLLDYA
jgi:hypothetical protein